MESFLEPDGRLIRRMVLIFQILMLFSVMMEEAGQKKNQQVSWDRHQQWLRLVMEEYFLFIRKISPYGINLAVVRPLEDGFKIYVDQPVYLTQNPVTRNSATTFSDWTSFTFGEPHIAILPDKTLFIVFWYIEPEYRGKRYIKLEAKNFF